MSDALKRENHPMFRLIHTKKTKALMSESRKGITPSNALIIYVYSA